MTTHDVLLPVTVLQRKAVVYVRQSTPQQVQSNLESQRRQYELVEVARRRGFTSVEVIDDDLGRTSFDLVLQRFPEELQGMHGLRFPLQPFGKAPFVCTNGPDLRCHFDYSLFEALRFS